MEQLIIITPKAGTFDKYLRQFPHVYKLILSSQYVYYTYLDKFSAKDIVCQILSLNHFQEFSLDKETNYYRLQIYVE